LEPAVAAGDGEQATAAVVGVVGVAEQDAVRGVGAARDRPGGDAEFRQHGRDGILAGILRRVAGDRVMGRPRGCDQRGDPRTDQALPQLGTAHDIFEINEQDPIIGEHSSIIIRSDGAGRANRFPARTDAAARP